LTLPQITVGNTVEITGRAVFGAAVILNIAGPSAVPGRTVTAGRDGAFAAEVGPFPAAGDYTITAAAGSERKTAKLKVTAPVYAISEPLGALGHAFLQTADRPRA
jgi:hypothetical protein